VAETTLLEPHPAPPAEAAPRAAAAPPSELEVRRRVERLMARELAEPSEELVRLVSARLDLAPEGSEAGERVAELCRRALREMGHERQRRPAPRLLERRHLDRRRVERALPGYYLG
jgi:hypothetical protein